MRCGRSRGRGRGREFLGPVAYVDVAGTLSESRPGILLFPDSMQAYAVGAPSRSASHCESRRSG